MEMQLRNGENIPVVGLGTWGVPPDQVGEAIRSAIEAGVRHVDCAYLYKNERDIGQVLKDVLDSGTVERNNLFITSKLWCTFNRPELVRKCFLRSLQGLQLDYLDLYLIHWPVGLKAGDSMCPMVDGVAELDEYDHLDTWKELEKLVDEGLVKSIGVSNFNARQVQKIIDNCRIKPVINQVEVHPFYPNEDLIHFCRERGVQVTAYSPFASPARPGASEKDRRPLQDPLVNEIATKHHRTAAQVLLRYAVQRGLVVIFKSIHPDRIRSNAQVFDFELSENDVKALNGLSCGFRACNFSVVSGSKEYPFHEAF